MPARPDPKLKSFVHVAADSHFPIQNLPYGVFKRSKEGTSRVGVAIGDRVLDLSVLSGHGLLNGSALGKQFFSSKTTLNDFMSRGPKAWDEARSMISRLLSADEPTLRDNQPLRNDAFVPRSDVIMQLPCTIENYTDFYSSKEHASNVGKMIRGPENALMPNWLHLPVAYHGRASSIVPGGVDIRRPSGQTKPDHADSPVFGPSRSLDFELELGYFIGPGNELGKPVPVGEAADHIFGMVLVNDWSARDIQKWEYVPLGPFLAKNFATSISPWVVPLQALEPFRMEGPVQDPTPLPYLQGDSKHAYDIRFEVSLQSESMTERQRICKTNAKYLYWNICQQVAHHTIGGCNLRPGDLLATGTISGPDADSYGSLLELAWKGSRPIQLSGGETRAFLEDGDRVTMTGWCQGDGYRIGFGELTTQILPAI